MFREAPGLHFGTLLDLRGREATVSAVCQLVVIDPHPSRQMFRERFHARNGSEVGTLILHSLVHRLHDLVGEVDIPLSSEIPKGDLLSWIILR